MKNKKGNLPIVLLVLGVFALCSLGLISFLIADFKTNNSFVGIGLMIDLQEQIDEYTFLKEQGVGAAVLEERYNLTTIDGEKKFYLEQREGGIFFDKGSGGDLLFSVEFPVPS